MTCTFPIFSAGGLVGEDCGAPSIAKIMTDNSDIDGEACVAHLGPYVQWAVEQAEDEECIIAVEVIMPERTFPGTVVSA